MSIHACHECDLLQREIAVPPGRVVRCVRCGAELYRSAHTTLDRTLAVTLAAALIFIVANYYPIVSVNMQGLPNSTTLMGAVHALWTQEMHIISVLVLLTTLLVPAVQLTAMLHLLTALHSGRVPAGFALTMRLLQLLTPWGMVEVFMLGILVALVKLTHYATVIPGLALWSFAVLILLLAASSSTFDIRDAWDRVEQIRNREQEA